MACENIETRSENQPTHIKLKDTSGNKNSKGTWIVSLFRQEKGCIGKFILEGGGDGFPNNYLVLVE